MGDATPRAFEGNQSGSNVLSFKYPSVRNPLIGWVSAYRGSPEQKEERMRSKDRFLSKNKQAFKVILRNLKRRGTLEPAQVEGIDRVLENLKSLAHSLDTSDVRRARVLLDEISKGLVTTFVHLEGKGE